MDPLVLLVVQGPRENRASRVSSASPSPGLQAALVCLVGMGLRGLKEREGSMGSRVFQETLPTQDRDLKVHLGLRGPRVIRVPQEGTVPLVYQD